ncbi:ATP-binding protein [Streptomyces sp. NPDC003006]
MDANAPKCVAKAAVVQPPRARAFSTGPASVAQARRFVLDALCDWKLGDRHDDLRVCVSELATNAVEHGDTPAGYEFLVRLAYDNARLRLEVCDHGPGVPEARHATADDTNGRGLLLVAALADDWGTTAQDGRGKTVWAEFNVPSVSFPRATPR